MTVGELRAELEDFEEEDEVLFQIDDDVECESWTEDIWGNKSVHLEKDLEVTFSSNVCGKCYIELGVKRDE